jgi:orotidine-5'-phosphate decarboxylase
MRKDIPVPDAPWLTPWEQREMIEAMLYYNLLSFDNSRKLPLKMGGTTDIYIKLRDARNYSDAQKLLAETYANPLRRLGAELFAEIPDSVSCIAGPLSIETGLPYLTIREKPKVGRVAKADVIGNARPGQRVVLLDDVITDGASKLIPYEKIRAMGLRLLPSVVLVDRQQGWKQTFSKLGIKMDIWAGMTLHDVRKYLISNGLMQRCDPELEAKNSIILALDGKSWEEILPFIDIMRTSGCILKTNDLMLYEGIKNIVPDIQVYGRLMADLKEHDIPNTVKNINKHLLSNPPWAVTVHGTGGEDMVQAAVKTLEGTPTKVLVVTVLTSIDPVTCKEIYTRLPVNQVKKISAIAKRAGAHGIVCSPQELPILKPLYPDFIYVNPAVRSPGASTDDQKRVDTFENAKANGSDFQVAGRQFLNAPDPVAEVFRVLREELHIL